MLVEFGNHACRFEAIDDRPKVTTIHIPDADEQGLGGYVFEPGDLTVQQFKDHLYWAISEHDGITRVPGCEPLLSILHPLDGSWRQHAHTGPEWVSVTAHETTPAGHAEGLENFLREYFQLADSAVKPPEDELQARYWTRAGEPGVGFPKPPPDITALYTNAGRVISNINDGGGQVGTTGAATSTGATSLTNTGASWTTNAWAGYRVYAQSSTSNMVWANILSNTGTVLTVDRWYAAATPGGSAGTTPSGTTPYMVADGGAVSAWFVGLTSTNITPAATDTSLSGEITTGGSGLLRKIAPYAQTSGVATRSITLTPVYTAVAGDAGTTVYAIGVFTSMVVASTPLCMKFETSLNASATVNAAGDTITVTETITGS